MKVKICEGLGSWSKFLEIEYCSESETDCEQANKFVSCVLSENDSDKAQKNTE